MSLFSLFSWVSMSPSCPCSSFAAPPTHTNYRYVVSVAIFVGNTFRLVQFLLETRFVMLRSVALTLSLLVASFLVAVAPCDPDDPSNEDLIAAATAAAAEAATAAGGPGQQPQQQQQEQQDQQDQQQQHQLLHPPITPPMDSLTIPRTPPAAYNCCMPCGSSGGTAASGGLIPTTPRGPSRAEARERSRQRREHRLRDIAAETNDSICVVVSSPRS